MNKNVGIQDIRTFAFIWSFIFLVIGIYPIVNASEIRVWSIIISLTILVLAVIKPIIFLGFYKIWIKIGDFIGGVVSRIIMFILYFGLFTPVSLFLKIIGKDLLNKKIDKSENSYWIDRQTQPQSMKHQF